MNLKRIFDSILWSPLHNLQEIDDSYCPHYKNGTAWKKDFRSLASVDKWFEENKDKMLSGEYHNTTAGYYCPKCNSWHTTTSEIDEDQIRQWQKEDVKEAEAQHRPLTNAPKEGEPWIKKYLPCNSGKTTKARNKAFNRREQQSRERLKRDQELKELIRKVNPGINI